MKIIKGTTLTSKELSAQYYEEQVDHHKDPEKWRGLPFGHPDLDAVTGGARKTEFIVIAGAQKMGKTTLAVDMLLNFAQRVQQDEAVLLVSLEMSHSGIAARVFSNLAEIDVTKFRDYKLEESDWPKFKGAADRLAGLPILWNDGAYTLEGVEAIIKEYGNIRVVVVDYFQLMMGDRRLAKRYEQLEDLSRRLKQLANQNGMTVIALSQQTREALKSVVKQKDPNTMAGTQSLARDADMMLIILPLMKDDEEVPHMREIWVALSRNSRAEVGVEAVFIPKFARIGAPASDVIPPMPESESQISYWEA